MSSALKIIGGLFRFEIFLKSPDGKMHELTEDDEFNYCYEPELGDVIYEFVMDFLEKSGAKDIRFQVETHSNNGGPLIDYCLRSEESPMSSLSLEGIYVHIEDKPGWFLCVTSGYAEEEDDSDDEEDDSDDEDDDSDDEEEEE